jgi:hypothetical protein
MVLSPSPALYKSTWRDILMNVLFTAHTGRALDTVQVAPHDERNRYCKKGASPYNRLSVPRNRYVYVTDPGQV